MARPEKSAAAIFDVTGVRAIVTGAASGLGFAMAEVLAENGAIVTMLDRNAELLWEAARTLRDHDGRVEASAVDVADTELLHTAMAASAERHGGIDAVFANAGVALGSGVFGTAGQIENADREAFDRSLQINLTGALTTMQGAAHVMRRQGSGRIVLTASTAGLGSDPICSYGYIAAKGALVNLVRQAALDLAADNVLVNAIAPGPFKTRIGGEHGGDPEVVAYWETTVPVGRMGEPFEIQGVVLLLASKASSFMTGTVVTVDGGFLVGPPLSARSRPPFG